MQQIDKIKSPPSGSFQRLFGISLRKLSNIAIGPTNMSRLFFICCFCCGSSLLATVAAERDLLSSSPIPLKKGETMAFHPREGASLSLGNGSMTLMPRRRLSEYAREYVAQTRTDGSCLGSVPGPLSRWGHITSNAACVTALGDLNYMTLKRNNREWLSNRL